MVTRANLAVAYRITRKYDRAQILWVAQAERYNTRLASASDAGSAVRAVREKGPESSARAGPEPATSSKTNVFIQPAARSNAF